MVTETAHDPQLLREFAMFREAATRLEHAYAELKDRSARVDRELKDANDALARALAEREGILTALPIGVFRRRNDEVQPENREAERLLTSIGHPLYPDADPAAGQRVELSRVDREGRARSLRYCRVPLEASGETLELVEDQTVVAELRTEVERLDRLGGLAELALGVAHEMRNPLNGLAGFAAMLRRDPEAPKAPTWVANIEEGTRRLERIVRDLLAFARPGERELPVEKTLGEWLLEARAETGETTLAIEDEDASVPVRGSPRALGKVFANLIRNAREARARRVSVRVETLPGQRVSIHVEDDGGGIDGKVRDRLFDPFVGTKEEGSGLGLAFCARALEAMRGSIRLRSGSAGTCFELELPGGWE